MSKYRRPDLTRQFCCKGGSSCGFAYKHFLSVELQFLITHNCEGLHVSHVSSVSTGLSLQVFHVFLVLPPPQFTSLKHWGEGNVTEDCFLQ